MKFRIMALIIVLFISLNSFTPACVGETVSAQNDYQNAEKAVLAAWDSYNDSVDISEYCIELENFEYFGDYVTYRNTEYFYVSIDSCSYNSQTNLITKLNFSYSFDKEKIPTMISLFDTKVKKVLDLMPEGASDVEKLLFLHDYIAGNTVYDKRVYNNIDTSDDKYIRTSYGCIVNENAVCEGISEAFLYFCKIIGIEAYPVISNTMVHEWNMVKLGNNYYHIDITQDAPVYKLGFHGFHQALGDISHTFFLKSDSQIKDEALGNSVHYSWNAPYSATDSSTFENAFWNDALGPINYCNGEYYYISSNNLVSYNYNSKTISNLFSIGQELWKCSCGITHRWIGKYSKSTTDGKLIYFISGNNIYAYNIANKSVGVVYSRSGKGFIYSILHKNNSMQISIRDDDVNKNPFYKDVELTSFVSPDASVVIGDSDGSGEINVADVLKLRKYLAKNDIDINEYGSDVKYDNEINAKDVLFLIKILAS